MQRIKTPVRRKQEEKMKRLISLVLCLLMMMNVFPVKAFAEEERSLEEIIRPQVEAFAKSIDQKNADGKAQDLIISHGMSGGGKKLSVGKSSALTATLVNSELMKAFLTESCVAFIETSETEEQNKLYALGECRWLIKKNNLHFLYVYDYSAKRTGASCPKDYLNYFTTKNDASLLPSSFNSYDKSLETIAGEVYIDLLMNKSISEGKNIYDIEVKVRDTFDFDTNNSSTLEDLLGFIGMLLFTPFEWEAKCNFQIEIPIEKPEENEIFGDMDGSGNVDVSDAYFARIVAAKLVEPTPEQLAFCDVDRDGKITAIDANLIRKFAAGIIKNLPIN